MKELNGIWRMQKTVRVDHLVERFWKKLKKGAYYD